MANNVAFASDHVGNIALDEARAMMRSVQDLLVDGPRAGLVSREGYHRPFTRGGGYNRESHDKFLGEVSKREGDTRKRHPLSTKEADVDKFGFGGDIKSASMRKGKVVDSDVVNPRSIRLTERGHVLTDWPYNRGSTPPAFHPLPLYTPVDTRDENGALKEPDGRVLGRNYFSNHSRSMMTAGGFLNGLPRCGLEFRPQRVCGKGVIEEKEAREKAAELDRLTGMVNPDDVLAASHLQVVRNAKVKTIPIENQIAKRVVNLHGGVEWGPLEFLPMQLNSGPDLLELDLSSNKLKRLPEAICNMSNCVRINLDSNCLESLPQRLGSLKSLTWLSCCNNFLDRIPLSFSSLSAIQMFDVSNNKLPLLPDHVARVSSLTTLSFFGNILNSQTPSYYGAEPHEVSKMASLHQLASLTSLNLEGNKLTHVPIGLSRLKDLKFLRLGCNLIESHGNGGTSYPELEAADTMRRLQHLDSSLLYLDLRQNRIQSIPKEICLLSRLTHLDFSRNSVSAIPDEVTSLVALRVFHIDCNRLRSITPSIASMPWLRKFTCKDNSLGRVGGVLDPACGGTVESWRREHGPLDGRVFRHLGSYLQVDPRTLECYKNAGKNAEGWKTFDPHAGMSATLVVPPETANKTSSKVSTPASRSSRRGSRPGTESAMETTYEEEDWDETSTAAQKARARQELDEAKLRYTQRRNERFNREQGPLSPGLLSSSFSQPLKDSLSPNHLVLSKSGMVSPTRASRPHVRTYLFEHQLETSEHILEDGWKREMEAKTFTSIPGASTTLRSGSRRASRASSGRSSSSSQSHGNQKPSLQAWQLEKEERARFNAQMGIAEQDDVKLKAFEYYRNSATTPYMPASVLAQGL